MNLPNNELRESALDMGHELDFFGMCKKCLAYSLLTLAAFDCSKICPKPAKASKADIPDYTDAELIDFLQRVIKKESDE